MFIISSILTVAGSNDKYDVVRS